MAGPAFERTDVRVVDATYFLPGSDRDARAEYNERHIPGAVFFDIEEISDTSSGLPHMLPAPEKFTSRVRKLGLGDGVRIVVYDTHGLMSAARVWWMFRVLGHRDVAVLDGGLPKWIAEAVRWKTCRRCRASATSRPASTPSSSARPIRSRTI